MPLERYPQPDVVLPNDDDLICRYYRFNRFAELVRTSQLHFYRADLFKDENEGIPPDEYIREICRQHPEADFNHMKGSLAQDREASFASCWYNSDAETAKMWARYGRDEETGEDGVAVISTFGKLKTAISALPDRVMLGPINYSRKHFGYNVLRFITTKLPASAGNTRFALSFGYGVGRPKPALRYQQQLPSEAAYATTSTRSKRSAPEPGPRDLDRPHCDFTRGK